MLNERGGIESDLTAIRLSDERYRLFVGTTSIKRDLTWLRRHRDANHRVTITDRTNDFAVLGLMGPSKAMIANAVGAARLNKLRYFQSGEAAIAGCPVLAARLSYAGEAGWEIICRTQDAHAIYDALHGAGARPAGLFAQTSMRIEKKFLAYGHDLDTDISPFEAGLDFAVAWETEFIGKSSLLSQHEAGYHRRIATLKFHDHDATPLGNEPVYFDGRIVGKTTSAAFGYRIGAPVALAHTSEALHGNAALQVSVDLAGSLYTADFMDGVAFDPLGVRVKMK